MSGLFALGHMTDETNTTEFLESAAKGSIFSEASVDRDTRTIRNVRLLGRQSKNGPKGRRYTEAAIDDAVKLYEGGQVFLDHPTKSEMRDREGVRSVRDLAGKIRQPRKTRDGVRGDIQVLDLGEGSANNPADFLFSVAEQMPDAAGMSHRAEGQLTVDDEGMEVVEGLSRVAAVEVVTDPATTEGLFEQVSQNNEEPEMKWDEVTREELTEHRPDLVESIREEAEDEATVEELREENEKLRSDLDEYQAKEAERERLELIESKLEAAELPDTLVTEVFEDQLQSAEDEEAVDRLIEERKQLAGSLKRKGPRQMERDPDEVFESDDYEPVDDAALTEFHEQVGI